MCIFTNGKVTDHEATMDAIVELSYLPVSVIFVGIGPTGKNAHGQPPPDFSRLIRYDADKKMMKSTSTGKTQLRDCVQFLDFSKVRHNESLFAMELMAEIPKQVKSYFEEMNIVPMN